MIFDKDLFLVLLIFNVNIFTSSSQLPPTCPSEIYCYGNLLHTIQMANIFKDSKTFVDMKLKESAKVTKQNFEEFMKKTNNEPSKSEIRKFVWNNFEDVGQEFVKWDPQAMLSLTFTESEVSPTISGQSITAIEFYEGETYKVAYYGDKTSGPRPESYSEDFHTASHLKSNDEKEALYSELKAAAESGWDFSSRWFIKDTSNKGTLKNLKTRSIIPVDLNSILCGNAAILSELYGLIGNTGKTDEYLMKLKTWKETLKAVHWRDDVGVWLDYDTDNNITRNYFYPSNLNPLWTGCYHTGEKNRIVNKVLKYISKNSVTDAAGIPTSHEHTGEQWDGTNAWPPLQHIVIVGLNYTGIPEAKKLAFKLARKWIYTNYLTYMITGDMYEKYDSAEFGVVGRGGEYEVQLGFGWSNGVIIDLVYRYSVSGTICLEICNKFFLILLILAPKLMFR